MTQRKQEKNVFDESKKRNV